MADLKGTATHRNLELSFSRESQAAMRYRFFAQQADIEGEPDVAARFRTAADAATGHALGHLELLAEIGDPMTAHVVDEVAGALASAIESETVDHTELYPQFASTARVEDLGEVGAWMDAVAKADHVELLRPTESP